MQLNKRLKDQLDDLEVEDLLRAIAQDEIIIPALVKILRYRISQGKPTMDLLNKPNYEFHRAFLDGRTYEDEWLLNLLTTKEKSDNDD